MLAELKQLSSLAPQELDAYLEEGWFRMGQNIFTTHFLCFKSLFYGALWLRLDLKELQFDKTFHKLTKQNGRFSMVIQEASYSIEKEELFSRYSQHVTFETSKSLQDLLFNHSDSPIFQTQEISLYDGNKMIALGYFDLGRNSAAGISCVYDPDYKKYSLGKYMIYLKIVHCKNLGLHNYYPGYFAPGYSMFDYKLSIQPSSLRFFDLKSNNWIPISLFKANSDPIHIMREKLLSLQFQLDQVSVENQLLYYDYFDANLIPSLRNFKLLDYPLFLYLPDNKEIDSQNIVVFDIRDDQFHLLLCQRVWTPDDPAIKEGHFDLHLLKQRKDLFASSHLHELCDAIRTIQSSQTIN